MVVSLYDAFEHGRQWDRSQLGRITHAFNYSAMPKSLFVGGVCTCILKFNYFQRSHIIGLNINLHADFFSL